LPIGAQDAILPHIPQAWFWRCSHIVSDQLYYPGGRSESRAGECLAESATY
jgi:hypothetical protein